MSSSKIVYIWHKIYNVNNEKFDFIKMKREKNQKILPPPKNQQDIRPRSYSPKLYLGCDTCKIKHNDLTKVKSSSKLSDSSEKNKLKKTDDKFDQEIKNVKLTDLCDEDKKRIVELIEELSRLADKNMQLKLALEKSEKDWKEQQEYINKQSTLHANEKNFYINEINGHKSKIESLENDLKVQLQQWKNETKQKDTEIATIAKALQKSLNEKNELQEQINHLRICLKHSLESFHKLRGELTDLQNQERKSSRSIMCQTENMAVESFYSATDETETEAEEYTSVDDKKLLNEKSSLDIINDKLEYVYQLLMKKNDGLAKNSGKKFDIDLSIFLKNKQTKEKKEEEYPSNVSGDDPLLLSSDDDKGSYKFLKPFDQCSKTSVQAQRILKSIGKPLSIMLKENTQKVENNSKVDNLKSKDNVSGNNLYTNFLHNKIIQRNNLFKSAKGYQYTEDQLLEDLFYSDKLKILL